MTDMKPNTMSIKDLIRFEYKQCAIDPSRFMKKYCMIQHPTKGKISFNLYDFQEDVVGEINEFDYNIVLKARQLGISTIVAAYSLWMMLFHDDKTVMVVSTNKDVAKNMITKVSYMHDNLPSWLRGTCTEDNKLSLKFSNGSSIKAVSSQGTSGRSEALSMLVVDEAAFIDRIDDIWASSQQTVATGGKIILISTPNGVGNFFHKKWIEANADDSLFNQIKLHWTVHPERGQDWRDKQDELLGERMAAQECDCSFITSGHTVIEGHILKYYEDTHVQKPFKKEAFDANLWIWKEPDYSRQYAVIADVARGDGSDYSSFHVFDLESMEQVAEYKGMIGTTEFGHMLVNISYRYNDAILVIENRGVGWSVVQVCIDRDYPNLFYMSKDFTFMDINVQLKKGYDLKPKEDMVPGFSTTTKTRPVIIKKLQDHMDAKSPIIRSQRLIDELYVFIWKNGKAQARSGYNDDLVIPFSMFLWLRDTSFMLNEMGIELTKRALDGIRKHSPAYNSANHNTPKEWQMKTRNGQSEKLTWLL